MEDDYENWEDVCREVGLILDSDNGSSDSGSRESDGGSIESDEVHEERKVDTEFFLKKHARY